MKNILLIKTVDNGFSGEVYKVYAYDCDRMELALEMDFPLEPELLGEYNDSVEFRIVELFNEVRIEEMFV